MSKNNIKKVSEEDLKVLKVIVQEGKATIGTEDVLKKIKAGELAKIFLANNCPQKVKSDLEYYTQLRSIPIFLLEMNNEELGVFCKKNYFISVLGTA